MIDDRIPSPSSNCDYCAYRIEATKSFPKTGEDKPQNNKKLMVGRILVSPRQNLFSVKDITNSEITEFALFKNTQITKVDKEAKPQDLTKDANAIIIYHQDGDKNLVDLIYLLP